MSAQTLLVNFWYAHPVGHAIEGLRYCLGYHRADPELRISVILNGATAWELGALCPFIEATYPVAHPFLAADRYPEAPLAGVPRDWDWIVDDARRAEPWQQQFRGLVRYYEASDRHLRARLGRGHAGAPPPAYRPHGQLVLAIPEEERARARGRLGGAPVGIAVMPAGSDRRHRYPSAASWELILDSLYRRHPEAVFCLVGRTVEDERTRTTFDRAELDRLLQAVPSAVDCFDLPLVEQLAIVQACDVFCSPHTGFGLAALSVGTPWLAIAGGRWPEFFFNGVPFYSVMPDPERFPCYHIFEPEPPPLAEDTDGEGPRIVSMSAARIRDDLDELVDAASVLIERRLAYEDALADHFARLRALNRGRSWQIWSIDNLHARYV